MFDFAPTLGSVPKLAIISVKTADCRLHFGASEFEMNLRTIKNSLQVGESLKNNFFEWTVKQWRIFLSVGRTTYCDIAFKGENNLCRPESRHSWEKVARRHNSAESSNWSCRESYQLFSNLLLKGNYWSSSRKVRECVRCLERENEVQRSDNGYLRGALASLDGGCSADAIAETRLKEQRGLIAVWSHWRRRQSHQQQFISILTG